MNLKSIAALALLGLVVAPGLAAAQAPTMHEPTEQQAITAATVSATEAVAAAEKLGKGKVTELSLDMEGATPRYRVTLAAADGTETNYMVDATTGMAVLSLEPKQDQQGQENEQDGETADDNGGEANGQ